MSPRVIAFIVLIISSSTLAASEVRVGGWNIQDLHHLDGFSLRKFGNRDSVRRRSVDFAMLIKYRDLFGRDGRPADVVALQEIGTKAALDRIFPPEEYQTLISPRWQGDSAAEGEGDVYTALAVRKASGVKVVAPDNSPSLMALSVYHTDGYRTRAGTGALLQFEGKQFWFLSVHLKSSCASTRTAHMSTDDDCETLWKQMPALASWIDEKRATGIPFIIAGDFNRRFRQFVAGDPVWNAMNGTVPDGAITQPWVVRHPASVTRRCPTRSGSSTQPIDWIVLDALLASAYVDQSYWERRFEYDDVKASQNGRGLSDHCPISVDIAF